MTTMAFKSVFVMLVEALWFGEASLCYLRGCCHWLAIPGDNVRNESVLFVQNQGPGPVL